MALFNVLNKWTVNSLELDGYLSFGSSVVWPGGINDFTTRKEIFGYWHLKRNIYCRLRRNCLIFREWDFQFLLYFCNYLPDNTQKNLDIFVKFSRHIMWVNLSFTFLDFLFQKNEEGTVLNSVSLFFFSRAVILILSGIFLKCLVRTVYLLCIITRVIVCV